MRQEWEPEVLLTTQLIPSENYPGLGMITLLNDRDQTIWVLQDGSFYRRRQGGGGG